jgi:hypothetical protein
LISASTWRAWACFEPIEGCSSLAYGGEEGRKGDDERWRQPSM